MAAKQESKPRKAAPSKSKGAKPAARKSTSRSAAAAKAPNRLKAANVLKAAAKAAAPEAPPEPSAASTTRGSSKSPDTRRLSAAEVLLLQKVFGPGIQYPKVRLTRMNSVIEVVNGQRAYTLGNTLHLPSKIYVNVAKYPSILVHELVHTWQYQHGGWSYVPEAVWAQCAGDGYDFAKALREGKSWKKMNPEQQAQMIQDAFRCAYFDTPGARFGVRNGKGVVVRPGSKPPDGFTDYTDALLAALDILRKPA